MQETYEMWVGSLGQEDPLEEGMATHSSALALSISWTEELEGLRSLGLQRVGPDRSNLARIHRKKDTIWSKHKSIGTGGGRLKGKNVYNPQ